MARLSIFDKILSDALRAGLGPIHQKKAVEWLRNKSKTLGKNITPNKMMKDQQRMKNQVVVGKMYAFWYDAKYKKTLPYWDKFPLIFPIAKSKGSMIGINLHYLPPVMRARLMDALMAISNNKKYDNSTKIVLSYQLLKGAAKFKFFKPCVKKYLANHVQSKFIEIYPVEWNIALFLPLERFQKASKQEVWEDSKKIISGSK